MTVIVDIEKSREVAQILYNAYSGQGIFGHTEMPWESKPSGVKRGSLEHIMFITLTVSINYQRHEIFLWDSSRKTFEDEETRYLFSPKALNEVPLDKIAGDMKKYGLSMKHTQDANIWRTVGVSFYRKWGGNPLNFLKCYDFDAPLILKALKKSAHVDNGREVSDYPFLRGDKIGPLWIKMLVDNARVKDFKNLNKVPIPVDIHIARASLALGIVTGRFEGRLEELFDQIRLGWSEGVKGISLTDRTMIALDIDEALWHLSKYGCSRRDKATGICPQRHKCHVGNLCAPGKVNIEKGKVELET